MVTSLAATLSRLRDWISARFPVPRREVETLRERIRRLEGQRLGLASTGVAGADPRPSVADQRAEIRRLLTQGLSQAEIARRLGVSRQWVHKLVRRGL